MKSHPALSRTLSGTLAILIVAFLYSAGPAAAAGPCTDVQIVGLRGSTEGLSPIQHDMGALAGPVADEIATQASGAVTIGFHGIRYPATDAVTGVLTGSYWRSKEAGSAQLHDHLHAAAADCPAMRFVVLGYSQGAHAAGDQLATEPSWLTDRVAALVMFGDPRFNPGASYTLGTFDPRNHGIAGARSLADFAGWSSRVFSFCNNRDLVCQGVGWGHSGDSHAASAYLDNYKFLAAGLVRHKLGLTAPAKVPLDLAFVIDSTGSMWTSIEGVEAAAANMVSTLDAKGADFRVGLVDYKDTDQGDPYASRVALEMSASASAFGSAVSGLEASGGGDYPEAVFSGLMTAIDDLGWRSGARKAIVLMGDAPAKDPEPITGFTQESVLQAARGLDGFAAGGSGAPARSSGAAEAFLGLHPVSIYPVPVYEDAAFSFQPLADGSGGKLFQASDPSAVSDEILEAVDEAATPLNAGLTVGSPARPGTPVPFSAAASYYDAGEIVSYSWDFDGDGGIDATTGTKQTTHVYGAPFQGDASVTVKTDDGHEASASAFVDIRIDAPIAPSPPTGLTATGTRGGTTVQASWGPPNDLGGGALVGYQVLVEESATGKPVAALATVDPVATMAELMPDAYTLRVWAVTEGGAGAPATMAVDLSPEPEPEPAGSASAPAGNTPAPSRRGRALAARVAWIRDGRIAVRLRCQSIGDCRGAIRLVADSVTLGRKRFDLEAGERALIRLGVTRAGRKLLRESKGTLRVNLFGRGAKQRVVKLRR